MMRQNQVDRAGMLRTVCGGVIGLLRAVQAVPVRHTLAAAVLATGASVVMQARAAEDGASEDSAAAKSSDDGSGCENGGCDKKAAVDPNENDVCDDESDCDDCGNSNPDDTENDDQVGDDDPAPVTSDTGEKWEIAHDLVVKVRGRDFKLTRQYTSDPRLSNDPYASPYIPVYYEPAPDGGGTISGLPPAISTYQPPTALPSVAPNVGNGWGFSNLRSISLAQFEACVVRPCIPGPQSGIDVEALGSVAWLNRPNRKPRQFSLPYDLISSSYQISDPAGGPGNQSVLVYPGFTRTVVAAAVGCGTPCDGSFGHVPRSYLYTGKIRFQEPGQWKQDFTVEDNVGFIVLDEDEYGNTRHYIDTDFDTVPDYILLNSQNPFDGNGDPVDPTESESDAWIELYWDQTVSTHPKLARAEVYRPRSSGGPVVTQYVKYYYYKNDSGTDYIMHWDKDFDPDTTSDLGYTELAGIDPHGNVTENDLGSDGDLVQVETYTAVDLNELNDYGTGSTAVSEPQQWRAQVTQYRYHDNDAAPTTGDIRLRTEGKAHQLKMELMPQQIEFAVQQRLSGLMSPPTASDMSVVEESHELLELADDAEAFEDSGSNSVKVYQVAAKIISYNRSQNLDHLWTVQSPVDAA